MRNSLNLVGDGDDLDLLSDIERTFGISIGREAESIHTVGELYDLIQTKCGAAGTRACLLQIAFYRLRRALDSFGKTGVGPNTPITVLRDIGGTSFGRTWREIGRSAGLTLPPLETPFHFDVRLPTGLAWIALLFGTVAFVDVIRVLSRYSALSPVALIFILITGTIAFILAVQYCIYLIFRGIPRRLVTVGDLAREAAGYSFEELQKVKSTPSPADRWFALTAILRRISWHKPTINRSTTFFSR